MLYEAGIAQLVEHHVANVAVAGSSPVSRSIFYGGIAKWLRQRSAKPLFTGSNPVAASIFCLEQKARTYSEPFLFYPKGQVKVKLCRFP